MPERMARYSLLVVRVLAEEVDARQFQLALADATPGPLEDDGIVLDVVNVRFDLLRL